VRGVGWGLLSPPFCPALGVSLCFSVFVLAAGFSRCWFFGVGFLPWCCFLVFVFFLVCPFEICLPGVALVFLGSVLCDYFGVFCTVFYIYI